jgi:glyoxylase-like metal-dependent hydrolase (beta-lactamase superfamily II)
MPAPLSALAHDWFSVDPQSDGVTLIGERHIAPFYRCNIWHIAGRTHDLLIDSGMGVVSLTAALPWLAQRDILAVASHCHFDHIGNHHEFPRRACHPAEAEILRAPTAVDTLADRFATVEMFDRLPRGGYRQDEFSVRPAPATQLLEAGDVIDLGDRHFEILHLPGHSPGSIGLWEAKTGVLFSGDAIYDGPLVDDAHHSNRDDYMRSLERLRAAPVRVVHAGHFPSFGRERLLELIDAYLANV